MPASALRTKRGLTSKLRQRHDQRVFERAVRNASPAMRQELYAAAARQRFHIM